MNVKQLTPAADQQTQFAWSHHVTVPDAPGCYVLATYAGGVLYVGLASKSIRARMGAHLDTQEKLKGGPLGVPFWFYFKQCTSGEVNAIERGWMQQSILIDGELPYLNRVYSPS